MVNYKNFVFSMLRHDDDDDDADQDLRHVKVTSTPLYDDADQALIGVKYNLEVVAIIQGGGDGRSVLH